MIVVFQRTSDGAPALRLLAPAKTTHELIGEAMLAHTGDITSLNGRIVVEGLQLCAHGWRFPFQQPQNHSQYIMCFPSCGDPVLGATLLKQFECVNR